MKINKNNTVSDLLNQLEIQINVGRFGRDRMVVGYTTTCARSAYHH